MIICLATNTVTKLKALQNNHKNYFSTQKGTATMEMNRQNFLLTILM